MTINTTTAPHCNELRTIICFRSTKTNYHTIYIKNNSFDLTTGKAKMKFIYKYIYKET